MELRQLEYFVAVAEEASFTKAAARLFVAQPGVSAQIRRLEQELGHELLDRSGRTVRLTDVGEAMLAYARTVLDSVARMWMTAEEFAGLARGRVAMGMVRSCSSVDLPPLLAGFHKDYPGVEITLTEDNSDKLVENILGGQLDVGIVALTEDTPDGIGIEIIVDEDLVIAVSPSDQMANRLTAGITALRDRALLSLPKGTGIRTCLDQACTAAGFAPRVTLEVTNLAMLAELAIRGLGPAVLPASVAAEYADDLHAIRVAPPGLRGRMAVAWRTEGPVSPAARMFVKYARAARATLGGDSAHRS